MHYPPLVPVGVFLHPWFNLQLVFSPISSSQLKALISLFISFSYKPMLPFFYALWWAVSGSVKWWWPMASASVYPSWNNSLHNKPSQTRWSSKMPNWCNVWTFPQANLRLHCQYPFRSHSYDHFRSLAISLRSMRMSLIWPLYFMVKFMTALCEDILCSVGIVLSFF